MPAKLESLGPRSADCPLRTAVAKAIILPLWGLRGIDQLESYDFGAERKRLKSPDRCLFNRAIASYGWLPSVAFVERHRGQVPLNSDKGGFNVRRFATRALACGERVRYPTIFPKSLIRYLMTWAESWQTRGWLKCWSRYLHWPTIGLH